MLIVYCTLQTDTALTYDAVMLVSKALTALDASQVVEGRPEGLGCDAKHTWQHGNSLINYMKMVRKSKKDTQNISTRL